METERRQRLDEVGSVWPVADDVKLSLLLMLTAFQAKTRSFTKLISKNLPLRTCQRRSIAPIRESPPFLPI
jgi:hypothetical protein